MKRKIGRSVLVGAFIALVIGAGAYVFHDDLTCGYARDRAEPIIATLDVFYAGHGRYPDALPTDERWKADKWTYVLYNDGHQYVLGWRGTHWLWDEVSYYSDTQSWYCH